MTTSTLLQIRALKLEVRLKQGEMADLSKVLQDHPAKPLQGDGDQERVRRWVQIKEPIERRRQELRDEVQKLQADIVDAREGLNQTPLDGRKISMVIDRLIEIESAFATQGKDAAWDQLTDLTDWLESLEATSPGPHE